MLQEETRRLEERMQSDGFWNQDEERLKQQAGKPCCAGDVAIDLDSDSHSNRTRGCKGEAAGIH